MTHINAYRTEVLDAEGALAVAKARLNKAKRALKEQEKAEPVVEEPEEEQTLEDMTVPELKALAEERGVELDSKAKKADIVEVLEASEDESEEDEEDE